MTTAFVLSGGASLAAVQVGMMQALSERGIHPDCLVGTSSGALNAAYVAGHGDSSHALEDLAELWAGMRRRTVFPLQPNRTALAFLGLRDSLCSPDPLARLLEAQLPFKHLEDTLVPLHLVSTDVLTGREVVLSSGDAVSALLASCAIPGVFPAVRREGRLLCDGALANNSAISQAVELGADRIYLLTGGTTCARERPPRHPLAASLHAITLLLQQRALLETRIYAGQVDLHVIPPLCPLTVSGADFSHGRELVDRARVFTGDWLDEGHDTESRQDQYLSLHAHSPAPTASAGPSYTYHYPEETSA
jgi:NTE family protein